LTEYDLTAKKVVKTIKVDDKPIDLKVVKGKNKIYVLSAGTNSIQVIDIPTFSVVNKIQLKEGGFYKTVNILPSLTRALISSVDSYELAIVDLVNEKVVDYLPVRTSINSLLVTQRMK
jgi:DNA-binding beta-propeller fold protein YncE